MAKLGEICKLNMGQSPDSSSYNDTGDGVPFFQGNADFGEVHPNIRVWCNAPTKIAHPGEILISVRAPIGAIYKPPILLQNQFANFVERVDQQKQTVQQSLEKLELMKKALMQEYFR